MLHQPTNAYLNRAALAIPSFHAQLIFSCVEIIYLYCFYTHEGIEFQISQRFCSFHYYLEVHHRHCNEQRIELLAKEEHYIRLRRDKWPLTSEQMSMERGDKVLATRIPNDLRKLLLYGSLPNMGIPAPDIDPTQRHCPGPPRDTGCRAYAGE